jgi:hypothetical protein
LGAIVTTSVLEGVVGSKPLVFLDDDGVQAWVMDVGETGLDMVRDAAGSWSPGFAMPQRSYDMLVQPYGRTEDIIREARAALAADPSLRNAPQKVLK